jgi:hypothetical protein
MFISAHCFSFHFTCAATAAFVVVAIAVVAFIVVVVAIVVVVVVAFVVVAFVIQAMLVLTDLDLALFRDVSSVWRVRCLPPSSRGVRSVVGVARVRDVTYYLCYYAVPVLTALLTPVLQLAVALRDVYATPPHGGNSGRTEKL